MILRCLFMIFFVFCGVTVMAQNGHEFDYKNQPDSFWKQKLAPDVYAICRGRGTEKPFSGVYDQNKEEGTYYCACCGGDYPLFDSRTKFDSGTGWPSFTKPFNKQSITTQSDYRLTSFFSGARTEVLCARCGSHLGHVFEDGPKDKGGLRYCMNSLALSFAPSGQTPTRLFDVP